MDYYFLINKDRADFQDIITTCRTQNMAQGGGNLSLQNAYYDPEALIKVRGGDAAWQTGKAWVADCVAVWVTSSPQRHLWAAAQDPMFTPDTVLDRRNHWI